MPDDIEYPRRGYDTKDIKAQEAETRPPRKRHWGLIALLSILVVPALLFGLWTAITLSYSYSTGERVGIAPKLSKKGWLCKTW